VQNCSAITGKVDQMRESMSKRDANAMSVRVEFAGRTPGRRLGLSRHQPARRQADRRARCRPDDRAATAIGDDRLQRQAQGRVVPDSFTHGTSAPARALFNRAYVRRHEELGDTFRAQQL